VVAGNPRGNTMNTGKAGNSTASEDESTEKMVRAAIVEARVVTPGIQALFGFQLVAVFRERFQKLIPIDQELHFGAIIMVALSIALIMTPAAYHRIAEQGSVSKFFLHLASWLLAIAMIPLMASLYIEIYVIGHLILGSIWISILAACVLFFDFMTLWFGFPIARRQR
jgi:hypothetical protein